MTVRKQTPIWLDVDISETDSTCHIEADITGFRAQNVQVTTWQNSLIIEMTREHERGDSYYLGELEPQISRRVIPMGFSVSADNINMQFSPGTLHIAVSKPVLAAVPEQQLRASA